MTYFVLEDSNKNVLESIKFLYDIITSTHLCSYFSQICELLLDNIAQVS